MVNEHLEMVQWVRESRDFRIGFFLFFRFHFQVMARGSVKAKNGMLGNVLAKREYPPLALKNIVI